MAWNLLFVILWILVFVLHQVQIYVIGLECGYPGSPAFGRAYPVRETYLPGEGVSFTCASGYSLQGPLQRVCLPNGTWAGPLPLCDRSLSSVDQIASSRETLRMYPPSKTIDGDPHTCTYTDKKKSRWIRVDLRGKHKVKSVAITIPKGFYERESAHLTIYVISVQGTTTTTASYHKCATFNGKFATDTLKLSCSGGEVEGRYIHINDDRNKVDYFSLCEIEVFINRGNYDCGEVERPAHSYSVRAENGAFKYSCVFGYRLEGPETRFCLGNGQWSLHQPICKEVVCPLLDEVEHGRIHYVGPKRGRPTQGTVANVSCDYGYRTSGSPLRCLENSTWSNGKLACEPVDCGMPIGQHSSEEYILMNGTVYGSVSMVRCGDKEGFRHCREDGTWSPLELGCASQSTLSKLGLVEEESDIPLGIVVGMAVIVFILLLLVIFVLLIKRKKVLKHNSTGSLPSKEPESSLSQTIAQQYDNDSFYDSIPVESANNSENESKKNYMSTILFTKKRNLPKTSSQLNGTRKSSLESSITSIYEEIGDKRNHHHKNTTIPLSDSTNTQPIYAQVDLDEKRRSRMVKSICNQFEPIDPPQWETTHKSERVPSFDEVDLEPIKLRELPPVPIEESDSDITYASLSLPLEPPCMRNNDIYEESTTNNEIVSFMKENDLYLAKPFN